MNLSNLRKEDYALFFNVKNASFLTMSIFSFVYRELNSIIIDNKKEVFIYLEQDKVLFSKERGFIFLENNNLFEKYINDFKIFLEKADNLFETILNSSSKIKIKLFFNIILKFFSYYKYTEFFYNDFFFQKYRDKEIRKIKKLNFLKHNGRKLLINIFNGSNSYLYRLILKISKEKNINLEFLNLYSFIELINLYCKKNIVSKNILELRKTDYIFIYKMEQTFFLKDTKFNYVKDIFIKNVKVNIIDGIVASRGNISGYARVIEADFKQFDNLYEIINEMNEGEILVTETTSPDLIIACHKASAIITNQGGLGSHAAIISRELKIPCIVGTEIATKVIKTGDFLKIDGNKGNVSIIKNGK